jgi:hypothetical protein
VPEIFLSYRRADSVGTVGRLFDRLAERFGADQVFRDIDSIEAGQDFDETIRDALRLAAVVLIVIGPRWLEARREDGTRRIDDPSDYVRREIEIALSSDAEVVPVLVEGAAMPIAESLPTPVRALVRHNDWELLDRRWDRDTQDLLDHLEERFRIPVREPSRAPLRPGSHQVKSLGGVALAAVAGFLPDLLSLLTHPRRFLARHARGRSSDLLAAVIFFLLTQLLSFIVLITAIRVPQLNMRFFASGVVAVLLMIATLSVPLWLSWQLVGATRHYSRLIGILLHQVAIVHLALTVVAAIVLTGIQLRLGNGLNLAIAEAMAQPASEGVARFAESFVPRIEGPEVLVATGVSLLFAAAGAVWVVRSWGAYRDAFGLSRRRSVGALVLFLAACWAVFLLFGWLVAPVR